MILLATREIPKDPELDAQLVEVDLSLFYRGSTPPPQIRQLEGVGRLRVGEEIPALHARAGIIGVRQIRAGDDLQIFIGERVVGRNARPVGRAYRHQHRAVQELARGHLQRRRHQQESRCDVDRLPVDVALIEKHLHRHAQAFPRERGLGPVPVVLVRAAEETAGVREQPLEEDLVDLPRRPGPHPLGNPQERAEVIVVDVLPREAEELAVGLELVGRLLLREAAMLDLAKGRAGVISGIPRCWPGRSSRKTWIMADAGISSDSSPDTQVLPPGWVLRTRYETGLP